MFAIYLPGRTGANPQHLVDVGLGDLLSPGDAAPMFTDLIPGPDNGSGIAASWDQPCPPVGIEWTKSPRGEFWFGKDGPLTPADFARKRQHDGRFVTLGDGNEWLIATLKAGGGLAAKLHPAFRRYYEAAWGFFDQVSAPENGKVTIKWTDAANFIGLALSINYRCNLDVASWLELIVTDRLFDVPEAAIEMDLIHAALKKKADAPAESPESTPAN